MSQYYFRIICFCVSAVVVAIPSRPIAADDSSDDFARKVRPVLVKLCFDCHGRKSQKADLRIDTLNADLAKGNDAEAWHDVLNRVNLGEMPPPKSKQPTKAERRILVGWLTTELRRAALARRSAKGRVMLRRLTRYEYQNTMRDLLGVNLDFTTDLPPEPLSPDGFLNNGATLEMSPTQLEAYLAAARKGLAEAIVSGEKPEVSRIHAEKTAVGRLPNRHVAGHAPANPEFLVSLDPFPRTGEFEIRIKASAIVPPGENFPQLQLALGCIPGIVHVPRKIVGTVDVTASPSSPQTFVFRGRIEDYPQPGDTPFGNVAFDGMIALIDFLDADGNELRYADRTYAVPQAKPKAPKKGAKPAPVRAKAPPLPEKRQLDIVIESVEFEAPIFVNWPPSSHDRLLTFAESTDDRSALPGKSAPALIEDESQRARQIIAKFMSRAFRRPVTDSEVEHTAQLFDAVSTSTPTFEEAIREVLASVLVSPHFLYVVETRDDATPVGKGQALSEHELAVRLSYFLWSSMPDERLLELASRERLSEPGTLDQEVMRLLKHQRASEFVTRFTDQWLDLEGLDRVAINPEFYPQFDDGLKSEMRDQTQAFFGEILKDDLSCLNLLESEWTMLNRPLARHYGIEGPRSGRFEKVSLAANSQRGGLLGQGAFLLSNSTGETSHPIKRAVWILDRLLDSPPAPPPPDVPELDADSPDLAGLTLKEQLAAHREKEACANCHRGIDPWGVPLENFDATGLWRAVPPQRVAKGKGKGRPTATPKKIDASSQLPDGTDLNGLTELKRYLMTKRREQFARSIVTRLLTYAVGRSLDFGDQATVDALTEDFVKGGFRLHQLIPAIVRSETFQTK
jgi:hypothetical protein